MNIMKKFKAENTAPHFTVNEPNLIESIDMYFLYGVSINDALKKFPHALLVEPECSLPEAVNYYRYHKKVNGMILASQDNLSDAVALQANTAKNDVICFETGEVFSFKNSLKMHARLFATTGKSVHKEAMNMYLQAIVGISSSKKSMIKKLTEYGLTDDQARLASNSKNSKLNRVVNQNLFLNNGVDIPNIMNVSSIADVSHAIPFAIKAMTGAGKNALLTDPILRNAIEEGKKVSFISSRVVIINKNNKTHEGSGQGFVSYEAGPAAVERYADAFSVCINSLSHPVYLEKVLSSEIVVIDEIESCLRNIMIDNKHSKSKINLTKNQRQQILEDLIQVIKNAPQIIVADADISPITARFLYAVRPEIVIYNMSQDYSFITASVAEKAFVMEEAKVAISTEYNVVVMFDQLRDLNAFLKGLKLDDESALDEGILVLSGDTSGRAAQQEFLADPDTILKSGKYRAILCSPTLGRGYSITHHYTNKIFVIANGTLDPAAMVQFPRRFRTATEFVYGVSTDFTIPADYMTKAVSDDITGFERLQAEYKTEHELLVSNISITLPLTLEALKFIMVEHGALDSTEEEKNEDRKNNINDQKMSTKELNELTMNAVELDNDAKAKELDRKKGKTRAEIASLRKFKIQKKTGVKAITKKELDFCKKFEPTMYKLLTDSTSSMEAHHLIKAFSIASSKQNLATAEITINNVSATKITSILLDTMDVDTVNNPLPAKLRLTKSMSQSASLKVCRGLLKVAGFEERRVKRVVNGKSVNMYVFILSPYIKTILSYSL
ncbi:hypothetical protein AB4561_23005 [Vibrio sp. 10N.222.55.A3]|uniref:hypothetical protein n=1 Tax=unclassified Vibrio TaxID=2614977 RepID=UPI0035531BDE